MCGINGLFNFDPRCPVDAPTLNRMRAVAYHRGPDDWGNRLDGNVGLAFNRLSIIDLAGGHQPMSNEDETVWIVFNGEIYNFAELRSDLILRGHRFRTRSDTETIVHAWEEYGEECVQKLRGMFAFFVWDKRKKVLFGARDRLGIKPLYFYTGSKQFAFASELKSLLQIPGISASIDPAALGEFLRRRYVIAPDTLFANVKKLPPGHTIMVTSQGVITKQYWDLPSQDPQPITEQQALEALDALLNEVVKIHLVSDVPLGAFLSGGLDSSCVVGLMAKLGVRDIKTFSIGYDSAESELGYAAIVAKHFATDHHAFRLTPEGFRDTLPHIVWHMDEPVGDTASIPCYYLARFARQNVTVALSGEGSDEIFGGYPIYQRMLMFDQLNRVPLAARAGRFLSRIAGDTKIKKYSEMIGLPLEDRYGGVGALFSEEQARRLFPHDGEWQDHVLSTYNRAPYTGSLERMTYVDIKTWLADDLLIKADRMTMANSLELRVPFLDHHLVEFCSRLPATYKIRNGISKYLLKKWATGLLPRNIVHRTKRGFPVPTKSWFRTELADFARETLLTANGITRNFFAASEIERLFKQHRLEDRSTQIYSLVVLQEWCRQFASGLEYDIVPVGDPRSSWPQGAILQESGIQTK